MKKLLSFLLCACLLLTVTACSGGGGANSEPAGTESSESGSNQHDTSNQPENEPDESASPSENEPEQTSDEAVQMGNEPDQSPDETASGSNILVAYFSLAGEQYEVGVIEKGNTEIVAEMIADATVADTFKIESTEEYPTTYDGLLDISRKEEDDPPEIADTVDNMDDYDTIFLGYPIWWGDTPTIIKVFLQSYDFSGKTIIPFCTHGGSGLAGTDRTIGELCPNSTIGEGLAIRGSTAQNDRDSAKESVTKWLSDNGYAKTDS